MKTEKNISSLWDSWIGVGAGIVVAVGVFVVSVLAKNWSMVVSAFGLAALVPSRYFDPTPWFQPLTWRPVNPFPPTPRWAEVMDWWGIALIAAGFTIKWAT
jgi:hypothetical protein